MIAKEIQLHHALMALTALSLYHKERQLQNYSPRLYQKALDGLRQAGNQDLASDGVFLTHFLLLLYEIADSERSWEHHLGPLLHCVKLRQQNLSRENLAWVIGWIFAIDLVALLHGTAKGTFVDYILRTPSQSSKPDDVIQGRYLIPDHLFPGEPELMPSAVSLFMDLALKTARIGQYCREIRASLAMGPTSPASLERQWKAHLDYAREDLNRAWNEIPRQLLQGFQEHSLPPRVQGVVEHVSPDSIYPRYTESDQWALVLSHIQRHHDLLIRCSLSRTTASCIGYGSEFCLALLHRNSQCCLSQYWCPAFRAWVYRLPGLHGRNCFPLTVGKDVGTGSDTPDGDLKHWWSDERSAETARSSV